MSESIRPTFLPFGTPTIGPRERNAVLNVLESGWIGQGRLCEEFERQVAAYVGAPHGVFVNSATAGLHLSLMALGIKAGDEVITTPMTFVATVNVIEHCGATPVLADIDPLTLNISPDAVAGAITPRTKAVIGVHFAGRPFDLDGVRRAIGDSIPIVEDAAHAIGGKFPGSRMIGSSGNLTVFSFYANKNITTGEGGLIVTNDDAVAKRLRIMRQHGLSSDAWERFSGKRSSASLAILPGFKYNSTDLNAALGLVQLTRIEEFLSRREAIAALYDRAFAETEELELLERPNAGGARHALHLYIVKLKLDRLHLTRDEMVAALRDRNVGAGVHYAAIHLHPFYRNAYGWRPEQFPAALGVSNEVLSLPGQPTMTDKDVEYVAQTVKFVLSRYRR